MCRFVFAVVLLLGSGPAAGQGENADLGQLRQMLEVQQRLADSQHRQLDEQRRQLEEAQRQLADQDRQLAQQRATLRSLESRLDAIDPGGGDPESPERTAIVERLERIERAVGEDPEAAGDEFPGAIRIPGTNLAARVGGFVNLSVVRNFNDVGQDDRFVVSSIPVGEDAAEAGSGARINLSVRETRLELDMRMDSSVGQFRAFLESDFAAEGETNRLRHAFGQYESFLVGQTWTTFMDARAVPEDIDFEGLNGRLLVRQPLVRWTREFADDTALALALEDPSPDVTGGGGVSRTPDIVARWRHMREDGHFQAAVLLRNVRAEDEESPEVTGSALGWGISLSGQLAAPRWGEQDNFLYQVNVGDGISRYVNDLAAEGGQDGFFDPETGGLQTLPSLSGYLAYQHWWRKDIRSTFVWGFVQVDNFEFQADDAYYRTVRATANVIWSPIQRVDLGFEFLWGRRVNKNRESGSAAQTQFAATFRF